LSKVIFVFSDFIATMMSRMPKHLEFCITFSKGETISWAH